MTGHARRLLREEDRQSAHLGPRPFGSHAEGPMRRDYRLGRFIRLAAANAPRTAAQRSSS